MSRVYPNPGDCACVLHLDHKAKLCAFQKGGPVMSDHKDDGNRSHFVDAGRAESEIFEPDPEIAEVFEADKHGHGARSGGIRMLQELEDQRGLSRSLGVGDPDADLEDANYVGEEGVGGGNTTPDQDNVTDIGIAAGLDYQDNEPLHTTDKIEERDRHRWELDPASAEDYQERSRAKRSEK